MFSRIANLFRGFLGLFISGLERQNPKALIEAEKENLRQQIARFNENLAGHAGFCERLLRQVKNLETQERDLAAKAAANLKVGNRNAAGQYALQLKTVKEQLEENRRQLEAAESTYKKLVKSRDVTVRDVKAFLTRKGDYFIPLEERGTVARDYGADLFISLHADGSFNTSARGSSVYCLSLSGATDEAAKILADKENMSNLLGGAVLRPASLAKDPNLNQILLDLMQNNSIGRKFSIRRVFS